MDTHETVDPVNEATVIRGVLPKHTPKLLSRLMGVPFHTAHEWLYRRFSNSRRQELARALLVEMDRQDVERGAWRRVLAEWAADETERG